MDKKIAKTDKKGRSSPGRPLDTEYTVSTHIDTPESPSAGQSACQRAAKTVY